jgi:hypothetical protein
VNTEHSNVNSNVKCKLEYVKVNGNVNTHKGVAGKEKDRNNDDGNVNTMHSVIADQ